MGLMQKISIDDKILCAYDALSKIIPTYDGVEVNITNMLLTIPSFSLDTPCTAVVASATALNNYWRLLINGNYSGYCKTQKIMMRKIDSLERILRLPYLVAGASYIGFGVCHIANTIMNNASHNPNALNDIRVGLEYAALASAMYLRHNKIQEVKNAGVE